MGIGNASTPSRYERWSRSHYPSWGSETGGTSASIAGSTVSLPLMGIGNARLDAEHRIAEEHLITPHGDRKPRPRRAAPLPHPQLITPHGDRKRPSVPNISGPILTSLPLMGIGNLDGGAGEGPATGGLITPHGDRKPTPARSSSRGCWSPHYPSWGSETGLTVSGVWDWLSLITPHGDRKRATGAGGASAVPVSLPLMGIGNQQTVNPPDPTQRPHYPSWGSETKRGVPFRRPLTRLITPHGDRKQRPTPYRRRERRSHYPSWGSETRRGPVKVRLGDRLITPHGDRKPRMTVSSSVQCRISLPLMGIGNPTRPRRSPVALRLITPHGDRKRSDPCACPATALAHYPSWGSETVHRRGATLARQSLITPHGDRKRSAGRQTLPQVAELITPHGDRKLGFQGGHVRLQVDLITPHGDRKRAGPSCPK